MTKASYRMPSARERELKSALDEAKRQIALLLSDASGSKLIEEQAKEMDALRGKLDQEKAKTACLTARCANLADKNEGLKKEMAAQKKEIAALRLDVKVAHVYWKESERACQKTEKLRFEWAKKARSYYNECRELKAENAHLRARLQKSPLNSSLPPSSSPIKKVHNSRVKTGRRPGAQPGHAGHRRRKYIPDEQVAVTPPEACPECGGTLQVCEEVEKRCLTDLVITVKTIEFHASECACTECGHVVEAAFPEEVKNEQNYGNNIRAISAYMLNRLNTSAENVVDFLFEATGHALKVSTGSVRNYTRVFAERAAAAIDDIARTVKAAPVIGSDATYTSSSGKRTYVYAFTSDDAVIYQASRSKGLAPLEGSLLAGYRGTIVHDHDISYYRFGDANAECNVHILRALKGVCENEPGKLWAHAMAALLNKANDACKKARAEGLNALLPETISDIEAHYDRIISAAKAEYAACPAPNPKYKPEGIALSNRLGEFRDNHLAFIHDLNIPFSNNASERALRKVKMKTKQSGGFRSVENGQSHYCDFLSVVETARKRDMEILGVVRGIFDGKAGLFGKTAECDPSADP